MKLFDNRNLLLCIDSENSYVVESKKIATIGRVNAIDGGRFRHIKNDDKLRDALRDDYYDSSYRINRRDFPIYGFKSSHLPEYVFIPKINGSKSIDNLSISLFQSELPCLLSKFLLQNSKTKFFKPC